MPTNTRMSGQYSRMTDQGSNAGCQLCSKNRTPMVMRMIGKTSETRLGLPFPVMAYLRYLVLRTRTQNSSASDANGDTLQQPAQNAEQIPGTVGHEPSQPSAAGLVA